MKPAPQPLIPLVIWPELGGQFREIAREVLAGGPAQGSCLVMKSCIRAALKNGVRHYLDGVLIDNEYSILNALVNDQPVLMDVNHRREATTPEIERMLLVRSN